MSASSFGRWGIAVADTEWVNNSATNTILATPSSSFLFLCSSSSSCVFNIYHNIRSLNTYLDNSTWSHESVAIVDDWFCALRLLLWQDKLLDTGPVQIPHLKFIIFNKWQNKLKTWSTNNQDDLMVAITLKTKIIWGDWIHSLSLILQLNFELTEVKINIFPLLMNEREICLKSQLMPWIVTWTPKIVVNSDIHFTFKSFAKGGRH